MAQDSPTNADDWFTKGLDLQNKGDFNGSIAYYDKALAIDPSGLGSLVNKGIALASLGKYEAISHFDKALTVDPSNPDALYNKGVSLDNLGNNSESIKFYDKVLAVNPSSPNATTYKNEAKAALNSLE